MHVDFDPFTIEWSAFTNPESNQNRNFQVGGYAIFRGMPYQRGNGLGSVFRRLFRYLLPIGKEIGTAIGRQGMETGSRVLSSVLEGKDLKQSLVDEGKTGLKSLLDKASANLEKTQTGKGRFDFKRYRKNVVDADTTSPNRIGKHINRQLVSTLGPPNFLPRSNSSRKLRKQLTLPKKLKTKRLRVDTLGTY
jgi:hypothetical protein